MGNPFKAQKTAVKAVKKVVDDCAAWKGAKDAVDAANLAMVATQERLKTRPGFLKNLLRF